MAKTVLLFSVMSLTLNYALCTVPRSSETAKPSATAPKTAIQYGGWKPIRPRSRASRYTDRWASASFVNGSERVTADTTKSFLLVYPPSAAKPTAVRNARKEPYGSPIGAEKPARAYGGQPRQHKMANLNGKKPEQSSDPSGLSTSNHHVQIQLLDGYIVPQSQGLPNQQSQPSITGLQTPIKAVPVNFNSVPEIRLLLPGDVHQQLKSLQTGNSNKDQQQPQIALKPSYGGSLPGPAEHLGESPNRQRPYNNQNYNSYSQPEISDHQGRPETATFPENTRDSRVNWPKPDPEPLPDPRAPPAPQDVNGFSPTPGNGQQGNGGNGAGLTQDQHFTHVDNRQQIQAHGYAYSYSRNINGNNRNVRPPQNQNFNRGSRNQQGYQPSGGSYNQQYNGQNGQTYPKNNYNNGNGYYGPNSQGFRPLGNGYGNQNGQSANGYYPNQGQNGQPYNQNGVYMPYPDYKPKCPHPEHQTTTTTQVTETDSELPIDERTLGSDTQTPTSPSEATTDTATPTEQEPTETTIGTEQTEGGTEESASTTGQSEELREQLNSAFFAPSPPRSAPLTSTGRGTQSASAGSSQFAQQVTIQDTLQGFGPSQGLIDGSSMGFNMGGGFCDCQPSCAPIQYSPADNMGSSIREIAQNLNADAIFDFLGITDQEISSALRNNGGYTLFLPSNEAISRLPTTFLEEWRQPNSHVSTALGNHVVAGAVPLDELKLGGRMQSTASGATLFINNYNNEAVTVNGHRIVRGDVSGPDGGIVHVIDGMLCPVADRDIIDTLRVCGKYDGFLTLADVTKLMDAMQGDGPYTVFLPSNDALTKIPDDELNILKDNVTALKEFLEYHIVEGVYFSEDLKDGQYLSTLFHKQPIRIGVRVDGCFRRLVEVNNSPVFKADIPTKNGVIHIVDWILRPSDLEWCQGVILP